MGTLLILVPIFRRITARKINTFHTTVEAKTTENIWGYVGVFFPIEAYFLIIERGLKVKVDKTTFNAVDIGDSIRVSEYSDGSYRLEPQELREMIY